MNVKTGVRMNKRRQRRLAIRVARKASKDYLGCRVGTFLRKMRVGDADAQMAFCAAAEDLGVDDNIVGFDIAFIMMLLELIMQFIEALSGIFNQE